MITTGNGSVGLDGGANTSNSTLIGSLDVSNHLQGASATNPIPVTVTNGSSGGTSSTFGAAFPATGTAAGFISSTGTMAGGNLDASGNLKVAGTFSAGETVLNITGSASS